MSEDEKKEFEEFLKWKADKAKLAEQEGAEIPDEKACDKDIVSQQQESFINANDEVEKETNKIGLILAIPIVAILLLVFIVVGLFNKKEMANPSDLEDDVEQSVDSVEASDVDAVSSEKPRIVWDFNIKKDELTDSKNIWASIISDNSISQNFPYDGLTFAKITIRYMKKYGYDAIISITKGQIHGSRYNGDNYITARFDEGTPKKYYFNEAADGSSEMVFISNKSEFIKKRKQAKSIKIDIPIYQAGRPVFSFQVDEPLTWRRIMKIII